MATIDQASIENLPVILPSLSQQAKLVEELEAARASRKQKLAQADELLNSLDGWLLEQLGLTAPQMDNRKTFAVPLQATLQSGRLNAEYFHPERTLAIQTMQEQSTHLDSAPLADVVNFVRDIRKSPGEARYVGLAHVQGNTGELVDATENASGNCLAFQTSDVLFGRLRPYLNKVYCAEFAGVCSPEFHVMRIIETELLDPEYLAVILRSSLILAQTRHMMTGNTHPRLTNEDVINLVVPIPDKNLQATIVAEVQRRRENARRLRAEAETGWEVAKQRFENQLLGGE